MPTRQILMELVGALRASSITSAMNQAEVPSMTIGRVCLTRRAYFLLKELTLVHFEYVIH